MEEKIDAAIQTVLAMIRPNCQPDQALKITQSALNLAHVRAVLGGVAKTKGA